MSNDDRSGSGQELPRPEGTAETLDVEAIREARRGMRFGQVTIIVHDGVVIQIDRLERKRLK